MLNLESQLSLDTPRRRKFPRPFEPPTLSPHPDHVLYPSYRFLDPSFVTQQTYRNQLQSVYPNQAPTDSTQTSSSSPSSTTRTPQSLGSTPTILKQQKLPIPPQDPVLRDSPAKRRRKGSPSTSGLRVRPTKNPPKSGRVEEGREASVLETPNGSNGPQEPALSGPKTSSQNFTRQITTPAVQRLSVSTSEEPKEMLISSMPSPPHPSANFFPFLRPVPAARKKIGSREKPLSPHSGPSQYQALRLVGVRETRSFPADRSVPSEEICTDVIRNILTHKQTSPTMLASSAGFQATDGAVLPSSTAIQQISKFAHTKAPSTQAGATDEGVTDYGASALDRQHTSQNQDHGNSRPEINAVREDARTDAHTEALPFGPAAPVVILFNQPPFVHVLRELMAEASVHIDSRNGTQSAGPGSNSDPSWKAAFLQNNGKQHHIVPATATPQSVSMLTATFSLPFVLPEHVDAQVLQTCVSKFSTHILILFPIVPLRRLDAVVATFLRRSETSENEYGICNPVNVRAESAIELLIFALGSVCSAKREKLVVGPGPVFYSRANGILGTFSGAGPGNDTSQSPGSVKMADDATSPSISTLDLARAYLLAALFCGQLAWLEEAAEHIRKASNILLVLILQQGGTGGHDGIQGVYGLSLVDYKKYPHMLTEDERQLVVLYWTCVQLELYAFVSLSPTESGPAF